MTKPCEKWANYQWPADESWRAAVGFPGYEVSDKGRIRTLRKGNPRLRKPEIDKDGYSRLTIQQDGRYVHVVLHRLVCEAFNGPAPADRPMCCHFDNDKTNNQPSNLRWDTQAGNIADKLIHGTHQAGEAHGSAKISKATALEIKKLLKDIPKYKGKLKHIAERTGASYQTVTSIAHKGAWSCACL